MHYRKEIKTKRTIQRTTAIIDSNANDKVSAVHQSHQALNVEQKQNKTKTVNTNYNLGHMVRFARIRTNST